AEMVSADTRLWNTRKSRLRRTGHWHPADRAGCRSSATTRAMAEAARQQAELGAEIIDINMGCPAKNVCRRAAGSACCCVTSGWWARSSPAVVAVPGLPSHAEDPHRLDRMRNGVRIARIVRGLRHPRAQRARPHLAPIVSTGERRNIPRSATSSPA
ncbi:MAG: tRNA-dihydrouridine synthase, partial [Gammaproteobacteria bacterium]|nr:tRNA-dihydrouridine synthase [Gammaproteobacteria bacterium]